MTELMTREEMNKIIVNLENVPKRNFDAGVTIERPASFKAEARDPASLNFQIKGVAGGSHRSLTIWAGKFRDYEEPFKKLQQLEVGDICFLRNCTKSIRGGIVLNLPTKITYGSGFLKSPLGLFLRQIHTRSADEYVDQNMRVLEEVLPLIDPLYKVLRGQTQTPQARSRFKRLKEWFTKKLRGNLEEAIIKGQIAVILIDKGFRRYGNEDPVLTNPYAHYLFSQADQASKKLREKVLEVQANFRNIPELPRLTQDIINGRLLKSLAIPEWLWQKNAVEG
jgi:hypothetical protein